MARESIKKLAEKAERFKSRIRNMQEEAEEKMEVAIGSVATVGTAGALAIARARFNDPSKDEDPLALGGVPMDLAGGLVMHAVSAFGGFGRYSSVGHAIGNGMLCSYAVVKGLELGEEMRKEAAKTSTTGTRGALYPQSPPASMPRASQMASIPQG